MGLPRPDESQIGKDWLFDIGPSTLACDRTFATFGAIFCFAMLGYTIWRNNQSEYKVNETRSKGLLWTATLIAITTFGLNQISAMFVVFPWVYNGKDCMLLSVINTWLYFGSKFFLWFYGIVRLHDVFSKSGTLAYSETFLKILVTIFAFECLLINILHILYDAAGVHHGLCVVYTADFIPACFAIIDVFSNVLCLWLFYAKMRKLWTMITNVAENVTTKTVELAYIIRKYTVLTAISSLCTILLGASVTFTPMLFTMLTIDTIINVSCLLLFDKRFDPIYQVLCCCCAKRMKFDALIQKIKDKAMSTVDVVTKNPAKDHDAVQSKESTNSTAQPVSFATAKQNAVESTVVTQDETREDRMGSQIALSTVAQAPDSITTYDMNPVVEEEN